MQYLNRLENYELMKNNVERNWFVIKFCKNNVLNNFYIGGVIIENNLKYYLYIFRYMYTFLHNSSFYLKII